MEQKTYASYNPDRLKGKTNGCTDGVNIYSLYIKEVKKFQHLSRDEETELLKKVIAGDIEAKKRVIESNLNLVVSIAKRFANRHDQLSDLVGAGNVGLIIAAEKFDIEKKASFATYAMYHVLHSIVAAAYLQSDIVKKPAYVRQRTKRLNRITDSFVSQNGREPTIEESSTMTGISVKSLRNLMDATNCSSRPSSYIDIESVHDYDDGLKENPLDILVSKEERTNANTRVNHAISGLSGKERQIVMMRFGLNGEPPLTLKEAGRRLGLTRQRIHQLEKRGVNKLRDVLKD